MWRPSVALGSITRNSNAVCFKYAKGWRQMNSDSALIIGIDIPDFSGIIFVFFIEPTCKTVLRKSLTSSRPCMYESIVCFHKTVQLFLS